MVKDIYLKIDCRTYEYAYVYLILYILKKLQ